MPVLIRKSSGEKQNFNLQKFRRSLQKAGANKKTIEKIVQKIKNLKLKTTLEIHKITTELLQQYAPPVADRYNLKRGLMELGPSGYPFELFIAELFAYQGYYTSTNRIIHGYCIDHEVDVIAQKGERHYMIESKFHNRRGLKTDVKITLYIQARFDDIKQAWEQDPEHEHSFHQAWVVTNTQFTSEAIQYAQCRNMKLLSWNYPHTNNLAQLITKHDLFPITTLTTLTKSQKRAFIKKGFVLCKDAPKHKTLLKQLGFSPKKINQIIDEALAVCKI